MIPSAIFLGFATGIAWSAATNFVSVIANDYQVKAAVLYSIFTGIVQLSSIFGNIMALATIRNFVNETVIPHPDVAVTIETTDGCVMNEPQMNVINSTTARDLTDDGVKVLSIGCSSFHVIATVMLFVGIGGKYKHRNNSTSMKDFSLIMMSLKGMLKQVCRSSYYYCMTLSLTC